jgi:hypothetical protein
VKGAFPLEVKTTEPLPPKHTICDGAVNVICAGAASIVTEVVYIQPLASVTV